MTTSSSDPPAAYPVNLVAGQVLMADGFPVDGALLTFGVSRGGGQQEPMVWQLLLPYGSANARWRTSLDGLVWSEWSRGVTWNDIAGKPPPATEDLEYALVTQTTAPPAARQVRFNKSPFNTATALYLHRVNLQDVDVALPLVLTQQGESVYVVDADDATKRLVFKITGPPIAKGGSPPTYWEFPVQYDSSMGTVDSAKRVMVWLVRGPVVLI